MIHKISRRSEVLWVHNEVISDVGAIDEMEGILIGLAVSILSHLAQGHHVAGVCGHQFSFFDRPACLESIPFDAVDVSNPYREDQSIFSVPVEYQLVSRVQALQVGVVEWIDDKPFMVHIFDAELLLIKVLLHVFKGCCFFFRECCIDWRSQQFLLFGVDADGAYDCRGEVRVAQAIVHELAHAAIVVGGPAITVV